VELIGREAELDALRNVLVEVRGGVARLVLVAGEPGIGKSTLVESFTVAAEREGATVLWGAGWDDVGAPSYWPWVQVLRAAARAAESEMTRLAEQLGPLGPLGPSAPAPDRFVLFDAVAQVLTSLHHGAPIVLVIDDLHAAGATTASLLEFVARHVRQAPLLLIATYRPAETSVQPDIADVLGRLDALATRIEPRPFATTEIARVLAACGAPTSDDLVTAVHERTQGNPLFVLHVARQLSTGGVPSTTGLPLGLADALRRRAELVTRGTQLPDCLVAAAVLGPDLRLPVLAEVLDADSADVRTVLGRAEAAGLLDADPLDPGHYTFGHALVREALAGALSPAELSSVHLRAARVLEASGAEPARLAHHFAAAWPAGGAAEAGRYCTLAGDAAMSALAYVEAADLYETALVAVGRTPDPPVGQRCELLLSLAGAQSGAGRLAEARRSAELAAALAVRIGDAGLLSRAALQAAEHLAFNSFDEGAVALLLRADALWDGAASPLRARVLARAASAEVHRDRGRAAEHAREAERVAGDDPEALVAALSAGLFVEWGRHDPRAGLATARRIAQLAPDPAIEAEAALWVLGFSLELGDLPEAERAVDTLDRLAARYRKPALRHVAMSRRAVLLILRGALDDGRRLALDARDVAAAAGVPDADAVLWGSMFAVWRLTGLAEEDRAEMERIAAELTEQSPLRYAHEAALVAILAARGEPSAAARFDRMIAALDDLPRDMVYLWTLALLANDCVVLGRPDAAERVYDALLPFADRFVVPAGGVVCIGSTSHELGRLARLLGRPADARAHLRDAVAAHRAAGCPALLAASTAALAVVEDSRVRIEADGEVVTVRLGELAVRMRRSRGLTFLAVLADHPGTDIAASHLIALADGTDVVPTVTDEVLDRAALASYRKRLADLDEEIAEAREWHDPGRDEALEQEREFLLTELSGSLGLGGRPRRFADEAERARVNVTRALRSTIRKAAELSPELGRHLDATVVTGGRCRYQPVDEAPAPTVSRWHSSSSSPHNNAGPR
jgi:tetratricopeptide (TPR) repeat protein